jgi:hypothetical protein
VLRAALLLVLAHDADIIYAQVERASDPAPVEETVTMTAATLGQLAPVDADNDGELTQGDLDKKRDALEAGVWRDLPLTAGGKECARTLTGAKLREGFVELKARFDCPKGELQQKFRVLQLLPNGYRVLLASQLGAIRGNGSAQGNQQTIDIASQAQPGAEQISGFFGWVVTGILHIFGGPDHIAFLIGVLLVGGSWRRVLVLVTTFTVAHSLTLAAAALDLIHLSESMRKAVEVAIAVSIVWVALENVTLKSHKHRALITFTFGLVHGFGFANVLKEYGLGQHLVEGVLGFNLGVELGQACIVLALFPLVLWLGKQPSRGLWVVRIGSLFILALGGYWLVDRALAFRTG